MRQIKREFQAIQLSVLGYLYAKSTWRSEGLNTHRRLRFHGGNQPDHQFPGIIQSYWMVGTTFYGCSFKEAVDTLKKNGYELVISDVPVNMEK